MKKSWLLVTAALLFCSANASATIVERVVAVVGERAILLSELRQRAAPFLIRVEAEVPPGAQRAAATSQIYSMLIERIIDEELQFRAAAKSNVIVTAQEVEAALGRIAAQNGVTVERLVAEARATGLSEKQYRDEVKRQVLEAKMLNLRLQGRIRVTDEDLKAAYRKIVLDERRKQKFRAAWIVVRAPAASGALARRRQLAERISELASAGEDFAALARRYSEDDATRQRGGLLPEMRSGQLPAALDRTVANLEVGQISGPVRQGEAYYVLKLIEREPSKLPSFEDARAELAERVYMEKMNKARRHWLDGLRNRTHVEVRL